MPGLIDRLRGIRMLGAARRLARRLYNATRSAASPYVQHFPAGHFYSPLPDPVLVRARRETLFDRSQRTVPGVDLNEARQLQLLERMGGVYGDLPFPAQPRANSRYFYENPYFSYGDAIVLHGMMRLLEPKRIIEVGSGFSSAAMLDVDERFLGNRTAFTFIEPFPERLSALLTNNDRARSTLLAVPVQEVDLGRKVMGISRQPIRRDRQRIERPSESTDARKSG